MCKKLVALLLTLVIALSVTSCSLPNLSNLVDLSDVVDNSDATKQAAKVPVDGFMSAFCEFNLKEMTDYTDAANIDRSEYKYLSIEEYEQKILALFSIFELIGLPLDSFKVMVEDIFNAYRDNASYQITDAQIQENNVIFTVAAEYIEPQSLLNILERAIGNVDTASLSIKIAASLLIGGLSGKSTEELISTTVDSVLEELDMALDKSISELNKTTATLTLVVYQNNGKWVISDQNSNFQGIFDAFKEKQN